MEGGGADAEVGACGRVEGGVEDVEDLQGLRGWWGGVGEGAEDLEG